MEMPRDCLLRFATLTSRRTICYPPSIEASCTYNVTKSPHFTSNKLKNCKHAHTFQILFNNIHYYPCKSESKRDHPARPVGGPNDGPRPGGPFTTTRQMPEIFNADEQEIRIMHQSGYNDGDPLSPDDQTYILDNVFNYHPDKVHKTGVGVKHIMVNKHTKFQESRCFSVVSTDSREEDFSSKKCVENYVKVKYPDKFDEFKPKNFKQRQPHPARDHSGPGLDEAGTPRSQCGWKTNNESWTPRSESRWKHDETETTGSQLGWNHESSPATSGWNKEVSTMPEESGAPATGWNQAGSSSGAAPDGDKPTSGWGS